jgi:hypothetical protein
MNWPIVFQGLSLLVATASLAVTLVKFANRKGAAFEQAQNALVLMKALHEQSTAETDPVKVQTSKALQGRLLERSMYASQLYVERTEPVLVNYAQVVLLGIITGGYYLYFLSNPLTGISEELSDIGAGALLIIGAGATWWAATLVMSYRANRKQLATGILIVPAEKRSEASLRAHLRGFLARATSW